MTDWWISLPYATGLVSVDNETKLVTETAPIFRWMVGRPWSEVRTWVKRKSGSGIPL